MRWDNPKCPQCGEQVCATKEVVYGYALLTDPAADGSQRYEGETEIDWDDQKTVREDGKDVLACPSGHEWASKRLED